MLFTREVGALRDGGDPEKLRGMSDTSMVEDDQPYREFEDGRLRVFGYSYDVQAVQQIATVSGHGWVSAAALMADNHLGYSMPIGGVAAYREMTSPSGVGYDIGCGVMAVRTDVAYADIADDLGRLADEIAGRISFGIGRKNRHRSTTRCSTHRSGARCQS